MRRFLPASFFAVLMLALAGCGGSHHSTTSASQPAPSALRAEAAKDTPGHPHLRLHVARRARTRSLAATTTQTLAPAPLGPPTPSSGWHVAYGDAFGSAIGTTDTTWNLGSNNKGCCNNSDEIAVERPAMDSITSEGLSLKCEHLTTAIEGFSYDCGGVSTNSSNGPKFQMGVGQTLAFQFVEKLPPNYGNADPASWVDGSPYGTTECDLPEFYGAGHGNDWSVAPSYYTCFASPHPNLVKWGASSTKPPASPAQGFHTYTTYFFPVSGGYRYKVYVDGVQQLKLENEATGCYSESCGVSESPIIGSFPNPEKLVLILDYGLRSASGATGFTGSNAFTVRSAAVYIDSAHAGVGIEHEGIAPGTVVSGEPPKEETTTTTTTEPPKDDVAEDEAAERAAQAALTKAEEVVAATKVALTAAKAG